MDLARHAVRRRSYQLPFAHHRPRQLRLARSARLQCPPLPITSSSSVATGAKGVHAAHACRSPHTLGTLRGDQLRRPPTCRQRRQQNLSLGARSATELRRHGPEPGRQAPKTDPPLMPARAGKLAEARQAIREPSPTMRTDRPHRTSQPLTTALVAPQ